MAISNATRLSDFGSGIGTQGAILQIDNANQRVGIGTTVPEYTLDVKGTWTSCRPISKFVGSYPGHSITFLVIYTNITSNGNSSITSILGDMMTQRTRKNNNLTFFSLYPLTTSRKY